MRKLSAGCLLLVVVGCGKKEETAAGMGAPAGTGVAPAPTGTAPAGSGGAPAPTGTGVAPAPAPSAAPAPAGDSGTALPVAELPPLSADILPKVEATPKSRVVIAPDFRYQIPQDFKPTSRAGVVAYTGTVEGFGKPATLTFWATSEPFEGNLGALALREQTGDAAEAEVGDVLVMVGGDVKQRYGKRMTIRAKDRVELRTLVVHGGKAFRHHCATPNEANAWANVGSDCLTRATTFHVAPPPLKPVMKLPAAPEVPNVIHLGNKLEGSARKKDDVYPWLDDHIAPFVKPCIARLPSGSTVQVVLMIGKEGRVLDTVINAKNVDGQAAPPERAVLDCIGKAGGKSMGTAAPDVATAGMRFVVQ